MRRQPTDAERLLWFHLRDRRLGGYKFRRQQIFGGFIADFACVEARLVVEADGGQHRDQVAEDAARSAWFDGEGYRVLRFWNHEILQGIEAVLAAILEALQERAPSPQPLSCP